MQIHISNMTCDGCVRSVTKAIHKVDAGADVQADLNSGTVAVKTSAERSQIVSVLAQAGYEVKA